MSVDAYRRLEQRFRRILVLRDAGAVLSWDRATMMPPGGAVARAEQMAEIEAVRHDLLTAPEMGDLFAAAGSGDGLDAPERTNLREMERLWRRATALGGDLVVALSKSASRCETAWREARPRADFALVLGPFREQLALVREAARAKSECLGIGPYDALLDEHEPDLRSAEVEGLFGDLERFLPEFLGRVLERQGRLPPVPALAGRFPVERQRALGIRLMEALGFDFRRGRLDVSLHPFCGGVAEDVRITTRYDEADFTRSLMGVLHETGHALYEHGLPASWRHRAAGEARGMAMHESQSLLIEMQACRSREFLAFAAPLIRDAFAVSGPTFDTEALFRLYTRVEPGFIRVDADEVTYPAHVILRFRLEKAMVEGELEAADLPGAWNEGFGHLLGLTPPSDREGCLQDIHWYDGAFGYFPTYTLGAIMAAQFFDAACRSDSGIRPGIVRGDFRALVSWLRTHVHAKASLASTQEILVEATGRPLDAATYRRHLHQRYLGES